MKAAWLIAVAVIVSACVAIPDNRPAVSVFNFSQGLARQDSTSKWEIYAEGNDFVYETNGKCIANGESKPCMWHAVAFEFIAEAEITTLECMAVFSKPTDVADPEALRAVQATNHTFAAELRGRTGRVFWHGYIIRDENPTLGNTSVTCRNNGKKVLSYSYSTTDQPSKLLEPTR